MTPSTSFCQLATQKKVDSGVLGVYDLYAFYGQRAKSLKAGIWAASRKIAIYGLCSHRETCAPAIIFMWHAAGLRGADDGVAILGYVEIL